MYYRAAELSLALPEVECEDGSLISPLTVRQEDNSEFDDYSIEPNQDMNHKTHITLKLRYLCALARIVVFGLVLCF